MEQYFEREPHLSGHYQDGLLPYSGSEHLPFDLGNGDRGALLIHGFLGTPAEIRPLANTLVDNGWHARGILLPGFGSDMVNLDKFGIDDWLKAVEHAYQSLVSETSTTVLIGNSMGGTLALHLARTLKPKKLVLLAPFWRLPGVFNYLAGALNFFSPTLKPFQRAAFDQANLRELLLQIIPNADLDDPNTQNFIREQFVLPTKTIKDVLRLGKLAYKNASQVAIPTYIIQGNKDPVVTPSNSKRLLHRLPAHLTEYLEVNAGHEILTDSQLSKRQVIPEVLRFLT